MTSVPSGRVKPSELLSLNGRTILVTGAGGMLGSAFCEALAQFAEGCRVVAPDRAALDVTDRHAVLAYASVHPHVILHCAADVNADRCEQDPERCRMVQVEGTDNVIALARASGARVVYPQSILVYDGSENPATEETTPAPLSVYGRCKLEAERRLLEALPDSLIVRMAGFFGGESRDKNFVGTFTRGLNALLSAERGVCRVGERVWQPTYTRDLAENTLLLVASDAAGIYQMGSNGEASFYEVACACVEDLGLAEMITIEKRPASEGRALEVAPRPFRIVVENRRLQREDRDRQRHWREALREYLSGPFFQHRARAMLQHVR